jgi:hypothetical protein
LDFERNQDRVGTPLARLFHRGRRDLRQARRTGTGLISKARSSLAALAMASDSRNERDSGDEAYARATKSRPRLFRLAQRGMLRSQSIIRRELIATDFKTKANQNEQQSTRFTFGLTHDRI